MTTEQTTVHNCGLYFPPSKRIVKPQNKKHHTCNKHNRKRPSKAYTFYKRLNGFISSMDRCDFKIRTDPPSIELLTQMIIKIKKMYKIKDNKRPYIICPGFSDGENNAGYFLKEINIEKLEGGIKSLVRDLMPLENVNINVEYFDANQYQYQHKDKDSKILGCIIDVPLSESNNQNYVGSINQNKHIETKNGYLMAMIVTYDPTKFLFSINSNKLFDHYVAISIDDLSCVISVLKTWIRHEKKIAKSKNRKIRKSTTHPYCQYGSNCAYGPTCHNIHIVPQTSSYSLARIC